MADDSNLLRHHMPAHEIRSRFDDFHAATGVHPGDEGRRGHDLGEGGKVILNRRTLKFNDGQNYAHYKGMVMGEDRQHTNTTENRRDPDRHGTREMGLNAIDDGHGNSHSELWSHNFDGSKGLRGGGEVWSSFVPPSSDRVTASGRKYVEDHLATGHPIRGEQVKAAKDNRSAPHMVSPQFLHITRHTNNKSASDVWDTHNDDWAEINPDGPYFPH